MLDLANVYTELLLLFLLLTELSPSYNKVTYANLFIGSYWNYGFLFFLANKFIEL